MPASEDEEFEFRLRAEREAVIAKPSLTDVAINAAAKGVAGIPDFFINAAMGPAAGAIGTGVKGAVALGKHLIGNDSATELGDMASPVKQGFTAAGIIDPRKEPQGAGQRILDAAVQGGVGMAVSPATSLASAAKNFVMGLVSGGAGGATKELTGSDAAATAVSMATPLAVRVLSSSKANAPTLKNPVKTATLKEAQEAGYVVPPSFVKPSFSTNRLESVAGKAAIKQEASLHNQTVTNTLAAKALGLPDDTVLTESILKDVRDQAAKPYREIAALSPVAASALDKLKQARFDAKEQWTYFNKSGNPEAGKKARSIDLRANLYEKIIDKEAKKVVDRYAQKVSPMKDAQLETRALATGKEPSPMPGVINLEKVGETTAGNPNLLKELRDARTLIAKAHTIENALNLGDGNVSASAIGRMLDQGKPLTGELKIIGKFAQGPGRTVTRDGAMNPSPGVSGTDPAMAALLALQGIEAGGGAGAIAGGLPLLRGPARAALLSDPYQRRLLKQAPSVEDTLIKSLFAGRAMEAAQP